MILSYAGATLALLAITERRAAGLKLASPAFALWLVSGLVILWLHNLGPLYAAAMGLASVAVAASVTNLAVKPLGRRRRPNRVAEEVPVARHVRMPSSTSFPSGHSAAAFAFATGVGHVLPSAAIPLRALAALVAYSRVHTGVHYPGDVIAGGLLGTTLAQLTTHALEHAPTHRR
jgi:undecaprenyl-diphosphatase